MCVCLYFNGTFIIKFHFLCRQTLLPAGWQTRGNKKANECVCVCVLATQGRAGIGMYWHLFCLYFYLLFSPTVEEMVLKWIFILDFSLLKLLWRSLQKRGSVTHTHTLKSLVYSQWRQLQWTGDKYLPTHIYGTTTALQHDKTSASPWTHTHTFLKLIQTCWGNWAVLYQPC